jgi:spermidine/putrescine transport system ATP-binding protein
VPDPIIEIVKAQKRFGLFQALEEINLSIVKGEIVTLLGPSGCGKTTLMRMIAGFEEPTSGDIRIAGKRVNGMPPEKRPVNMVFQRYALFPHLDVFDNVAFGLRVKRLPPKEVNEHVRRIISIVQLDALEHRYINELSGGQSQRVALARALANEPQVLLLDEPLAALDLKIRQHMLVEMKRIQEQTGTTFLYVTHDQDEALVLSDRIVLMEKGRIIQIDAPPQMYQTPRSLFAAKFLGETNLIEGSVVETTPAGTVVATREGIQFRSSRGAGFEQGNPVTISLRPETILIGRAGAGAPVTAVCRDVIFMGSRSFLQVEVGERLLLRVQLPGSEAIPAVGATLTLSWQPRDVVLLAS